MGLPAPWLGEAGEPPYSTPHRGRKCLRTVRWVEVSHPPVDGGGATVPWGSGWSLLSRVSLSCSWRRVGSGRASVPVAQGWDLRYKDALWFLGSQGLLPTPHLLRFASCFLQGSAHPLLRWLNLRHFMVKRLVQGHRTGEWQGLTRAASRSPTEVPQHALPGRNAQRASAELLLPLHTQGGQEG